jgi:hypothetical protein
MFLRRACPANKAGCQQCTILCSAISADMHIFLALCMHAC